MPYWVCPVLYVSAISYVNNSNDYFVLNRDNGQPWQKQLYRYGNKAL